MPYPTSFPISARATHFRAALLKKIAMCSLAHDRGCASIALWVYPQEDIYKGHLICENHQVYGYFLAHIT